MDLSGTAKKTRRAVGFLARGDGTNAVLVIVPWAELRAPDRALLPKGRQRATSGGCGADAAHLLFAAVVQPVGPGGGRSAVRLGGDAQLRGHRSGTPKTSVRRTRPRCAGSASSAGRTRGLGGQMLKTVNLHLAERRGVRITTGTIVDATILHAPSSTKNREQKRDPEMHQDEEGQPVVLRHEGARGRGQQEP